MRIHVAGLFVLFASTVAMAGEPLPLAPSPEWRPEQSQDGQLSKVQHLRQAADHLEAAGATDLAREIREEAEAMLKASTQKLSELRQQMARLQQEIANLEEQTGAHQVVMLRCRMFETNPAQLKELGIEFSTADSEHTLPLPIGISDARVVDVIIDALAAQGAAKVLAEPVLVTASGRPATLRSGGEFPILIPTGDNEGEIQFRNFGITLEAVPVVLGGGALRLDVCPELATRDFENAVTLRGTVVPGLNVRRINTQVEMQFGQTVTLVMESPTEANEITPASHDDTPRKATVICITPTPVKATAVQPSPDVRH